MEDATFRLNMVYTLAAGTAQRPFAAAPVAVCNRRMQEHGLYDETLHYYRIKRIY